MPRLTVTPETLGEVVVLLLATLVTLVGAALVGVALGLAWV